MQTTVLLGSANPNRRSFIIHLGLKIRTGFHVLH